ncbi:mechanosensitive ion channel family protein [Spiribacter roseus]|uniref:mechanosensitive ion channel family protein n=1 Tax=Spiribacter roseus TaxID=1855875 RepID=UPI00132F98F8|nr:mechanosensitive ion channel family protein [Spiribacter roseus]KAF0281464.1 hypothetical protein BA900_03815 [Spiribacter roseus]
MISTKRLRAATFAAGLALASLVLLLPGTARADASDSPSLLSVDYFSPRASFDRFIRNTDALIGLRANGAPVSEQVPRLRAAAGSFDFDATPHASSTAEQIRRILMAREIIARLPMPPVDTIPDRARVTETDLRSWTVPGTQLRMRRMTGTRHEGAFRFDAATIAEIDDLYRRISDRPRLDGAPDAYQRYIADVDAGAGAMGLSQALIASRLHVVGTTSPRDTMESFLGNMTDAYRVARTAARQLGSDPPQISIEAARRQQAIATDQLQQAVSVFDLSEVPEALRRDTGIEAALLLKEILDRIPLSRPETIPDAIDLAGLPAGADYDWRIPGTQIRIERMQSGPHAGSFLFDANTVSILRDSYAALRDLEYRDPTALALAAFPAAEITPGFYDFYITGPGYLVPGAHPLGAIVDRLPDWSEHVIMDQTVWQWGGSVVTLAVLVLAIWLAFRVIDWPARHHPDSGIAAWMAIAAPLLAAFLTHRTTLFIDYDLNFSGTMLEYLLFASGLAELGLLVWAVWRLSSAFATTILASSALSNRGFDASLVRLLSGILGVAASIGVASFGLGRLGVDVVPLLAGLGVGGLAVALAARPTLENLIGGLILFSDKPVRVGDFCTFGDMSGTVEGVGIRSTQIRALNRALISVPNAKFVDMEIVNWARCDTMLIEQTLRLRCETSADQLRHVLIGIREMLHGHPRIEESTIRVRFAGYGESSLDVSVRIYALTRDWNEYHAIREDVNFHIKRIVEASGTRFAVPASVIYTARDSGLDEERTAEAEAAVAAWRREGLLAFPRLTPEQIERVRDSIDYPPEGSSERAQQRSRQREDSEPLSDPDSRS